MDLLSRRRVRRQERRIAAVERDQDVFRAEEERRRRVDASRRLDVERAAFNRAMGEVPRG